MALLLYYFSLFILHTSLIFITFYFSYIILIMTLVWFAANFKPSKFSVYFFLTVIFQIIFIYFFVFHWFFSFYTLFIFLIVLICLFITTVFALAILPVYCLITVSQFTSALQGPPSVILTIISHFSSVLLYLFIFFIYLTSWLPLYVSALPPGSFQPTMGCPSPPLAAPVLHLFTLKIYTFNPPI